MTSARSGRRGRLQLDGDGHPALVVAGRDGVPGSVGSVEPQRDRAAVALEVSPPGLGVGKPDTDDKFVTDPAAGTFVNQYVVDLARNGGPVDLARSAGH